MQSLKQALRKSSTVYCFLQKELKGDTKNISLAQRKAVEENQKNKTTTIKKKKTSGDMEKTAQWKMSISCNRNFN